MAEDSIFASSRTADRDGNAPQPGSPDAWNPPDARDDWVDPEDEEDEDDAWAQTEQSASSSGEAAEAEALEEDEVMEGDSAVPAEEGEGDGLGSPPSDSSDMSDDEFERHILGQIGINTDGSGWMSDAELNTLRSSPVIFGPKPSQPIPHSEFRKFILQHLDQTDWKYESMAALHPFLTPTHAVPHRGLADPRLTMTNQLPQSLADPHWEAGIRVRPLYHQADVLSQDDVYAAMPQEHLEGNFAELAVRERARSNNWDAGEDIRMI